MSDKIKVFLPWRGEFGQMIMAYVRWFHLQTGRKIVCCREGDESLFPTAAGFYTKWDQVDDHKKTTKFVMGRDNSRYLSHLKSQIARDLTETSLGVELDISFHHPLDGKKPQRFKNLVDGNFKPIPGPSEFDQDLDIVLAPRWRKHGEHRNFQYWKEVTDGLMDLGLKVGYAGLLCASQDYQRVPEELKSWNYDQVDTTFHMMNRAKVTLATDAGLAHLAVLNQTPLLVIYDEPGREAGHPTWPWVLPHMQRHSVNTCDPICYGWNSPETVVKHTADFVKCQT